MQIELAFRDQCDRPPPGSSPRHLDSAAGDTNFSARWSVIKKEFTKSFLAAGGTDHAVSDGKQRERRRGVWQRRFWEHTIEDEDDFETQFDYIHYTPVKHGLAKCPKEWSASSFHRWVEQGVYAKDWGCGKNGPPDFAGDVEEFGEPED